MIVSGLRVTMEKQATDRISQLPQPLLHQILYLLSQKEAVRTCVLSKSWHYLWFDRPNIEFRESLFKGNNQTFLSVVDKTLQRYHDHNLSIEKFLFEMSRVDFESVSLLKKWIPIVIQNNNLRTFSLYIVSDISTHFDLPSVVFKSKTLQTLSLERCKVNKDSIDMVLLKNLQTLSLKQVDIAQDTFEKIMSSCPLIENVSLLRCGGFKNVKLCKPHNLKTFAINESLNTSFEIEDLSTVETMRIVMCSFDHHNYEYFPRLKCLLLKDVFLSIKSFDIFSADYMPCLECLTLSSCFGFNKFCLQLSGSVKNVRIRNIEQSIKASIDAPNIVKFVYDGRIPDSAISVTTTSSKWKSHIVLSFYNDFVHDASLSFHKLNKLLEGLSQSDITLELHQDRIFTNHGPIFYKIVPGDIYGRYCKPTAIENLSLRGYYSYSCLLAFLNCLFRVCRPRYIGQHLYSNAKGDWERKDKEVNEFLLEILLLKRELREYFWRQDDLEEVSLDGFEKNGKNSDPFVGIKVRLELKWRELI